MALENTHFGAETIGEIMKNCKNLFFAGIGGVSMCSLARISQLRGYTVSGYDRAESAATRDLERNGITVFYEGDKAHMENVDALIYTVAIPADNPEYSYAMEKGIPCISRADYLGYLMKGYKHRIGISGMHGKSTTTSMTEAAFVAAGLDPTVSCGAVMKDVGAAHRIGGQDYFVFEACEYMDSFLDFYPTIAVVLNIEMDHVDYFHSMEQIYDSYRAFMERTEGGIALVNCDDGDVLLAARGFTGKLITFGIETAGADYKAENIHYERGCAEFGVTYKGQPLCHVMLNVPGKHCVIDALAAIAAAHICGADPVLCASGLALFEGAGRRMDKMGKTQRGADIYTDYAHHPTEIATTLNAASEMGYDKVYCVFQPHTYSRTHELFEDFATALSHKCEEIILAPIYSARESNIYGISSEKLCEKIRSMGQPCRCIERFEEIAATVREEATEHDMIIVMGAGDITKTIQYLK